MLISVCVPDNIIMYNSLWSYTRHWWSDSRLSSTSKIYIIENCWKEIIAIRVFSSQQNKIFSTVMCLRGFPYNFMYFLFLFCSRDISSLNNQIDVRESPSLCVYIIHYDQWINEPKQPESISFIFSSSECTLDRFACHLYSVPQWCDLQRFTIQV